MNSLLDQSLNITAEREANHQISHHELVGQGHPILMTDQKMAGRVVAKQAHKTIVLHKLEISYAPNYH